MRVLGQTKTDFIGPLLLGSEDMLLKPCISHAASLGTHIFRCCPVLTKGVFKGLRWFYWWSLHSAPGSYGEHDFCSRGLTVQENRYTIQGTETGKFLLQKVTLWSSLPCDVHWHACTLIAMSSFLLSESPVLPHRIMSWTEFSRDTLEVGTSIGHRCRVLGVQTINLNLTLTL